MTLHWELGSTWTTGFMISLPVVSALVGIAWVVLRRKSK
jgi:hypothetical protein